MKRFVFAAFFAASLGAGGAALAADPQPTQTEAPVRYADLDLSTAEGAALLLSRLRTATARVCSADEIDRPSPAVRRAIAQCREEALEEAVAELDSPTLTQLHATRR